jgi:RimJ/RimL family protein N-acetyltransferase
MNFSELKLWSKNVTLTDGTRVLLRAQRQTDQERLWEMVSTLSNKTLSQLTDRFTHELIQNWMKTLDYDKIIPIMAFDADSRVVGNAFIHLNQSEAKKHVGVFGIFIHDKYQGKGLGTLMTNLMIEVGRLKGLKKIILDVFTTNEKAYHIYCKCGFIVEGCMEKEYWHYLEKDFKDVYRMAIYL